MTATPDNASNSAPARGTGIVRKGFWAVLDQGLFAGANGIVYILLARWLAPRDYGAFATAFAAFMGLSVLHTALLTEPMLIFASQRFRDQHKHYFGSLLYGHLVVALGTSLVLAVAGAILQRRGQPELGSALDWFAVASPFILLLWLMRRNCYGQFNPRRAAMGGVAYLMLQMLSLSFVHFYGKLTVGSALIMVAASSFVVGVALGIGQLHLKPSQKFMREVLQEHFRYSRYAAATQLLGYVPVYLYYFLLPGLATLEQSGALRALSNLFTPLVQASGALFLLLIPAFVRTNSTPEGKRLHRFALLALVGVPLIYGLFVGTFNRQIVGLVYGGKYLDGAHLLWIIALQPVIAGACGVYGSLLRARQKLNAVLWGGVVAATSSITLGVLMTRAYGLAGVCWSTVITYSLHHITLWLFSRDIVKSRNVNVEPQRGVVESLQDAAMEMA
jgi:O-antigen/teichoic acid export membrane protein